MSKTIDKKVIVKVNDRGGLHLLDLSAGAFRKLAPLSSGIIQVGVQIFTPTKTKPIIIQEEKEITESEVSEPRREGNNVEVLDLENEGKEGCFENRNN